MCVDIFHIQQAINVLDQGKIIAYPTESVFGLGCDPENTSAIEQLLQIKQRPANKGLILIAADISQLELWVDFSQVSDRQQILDSWPGHVTWLIPARQHVSSLLTGSHDTLAVRVSAHPVVQALCQQFDGAITSTSANKFGQLEARKLITVRQYFNDEIDYYLPGQVAGHQNPSRICHAVTGQVIRK